MTIDAHLDQIERDQEAYAYYWEHESVDNRLMAWFTWLGDWNPEPLGVFSCDIDYDDTDYECPDCGYDLRYGDHQRIHGSSWAYPDYHCSGDMVEYLP